MTTKACGSSRVGPKFQYPATSSTCDSVEDGENMSNIYHHIAGNRAHKQHQPKSCRVVKNILDLQVSCSTRLQQDNNDHKTQITSSKVMQLERILARPAATTSQLSAKNSSTLTLTARSCIKMKHVNFFPKSERLIQVRENISILLALTYGLALLSLLPASLSNGRFLTSGKCQLASFIRPTLRLCS